MSLILEALRKSEAQRRLGQAPDLLSAGPDIRRRRRNGWRGVGYGAALIAVAAAAWWFGQRQAPRPGEATVPAEAKAEPAMASPIVAAARLPAPSEGAASPPRIAPPLATAPPVSTAPATHHTEPESPTTPAKASKPAASTAAPVPASLSVVPVPEPLTAPAQAAEAPPPEATSPAPSPAPELPGLSALSANERQSLPPLRVTMHVYADDAQRRFAIIDGQRVNEGALLADGIVVAEIARDGVILDLRGRRIRLPRP